MNTNILLLVYTSCTYLYSECLGGSEHTHEAKVAIKSMFIGGTSAPLSTPQEQNQFIKS